MSRNLLAAETSPYLLQHKDNPVHWRPWGPAALQEARDTDKPILLSVGYAACHWCHVMAHESFENAEIARLMNDHFVNVKVDREERPDVDTVYQSALALTGQQGGWPLTMFLTPGGDPFWGGTYFPPAPRWGRPGFPEVLTAIAEVYRSQPDQVQSNVTALRQGLDRLSRPPAGPGLAPGTVEQVARLALKMIDPVSGGTRGAPKFPQPVFFQFLWRMHRRTGDPELADAVTTTLDSLCQSGIYDHVGGGFARYATDEEWLVPHFEKMLYDNALLALLLTEVWRGTRRPLYATRVRETLAWALADLRVAGPDGLFAFASAFDADSEGVEGKYYVWTESEIDALLGDHGALFKQVYDVTPGGNWEGHTIVNRRRDPAFRDEATEATFRRCLDTLRQARNRRIPPLRDDKVLADWNGLMIHALASAGATFAEPAWVDAARTAFRFVVTLMADAGRLHHSWCAGAARHPGTLDDYAAMARAALALFEATGDVAYRHWAETWVATADRHFWDSADGGYFLAADDVHELVSRPKTIVDHATPSGNGMMVDVLARLYLLTDETAYRDRCETLITMFSGNNVQYLIGVPGLLMAHAFLQEAPQLVIVGDPADPRTEALRTAAWTAAEAATVIHPVAPDAALPPGHPAAGKSPLDGAPAAHLCRGQTCGLPLTDPDALRAALDAG
ncbi:MAG: thioredoxin domain-containing protein [Rhodospirillales bacterium]|nr:MAG: thioredoxin domain-containing protein [Rhodospirillales bacterium]